MHNVHSQLSKPYLFNMPNDYKYLPSKIVDFLQKYHYYPHARYVTALKTSHVAEKLFPIMSQHAPSSQT